jgi:predicted DNA-binding transcriptional regulator YafY
MCLTAQVLTPTSRLLELLEILQAQPLTTGREIAQRLRIDARTVRRYIAALQALDIPVEGQRGVGGGYRVRPGYRLPPLMLNDDEAVAVVLGLIGARGPAVDREAEPVDGALAKILRVLPAPLRSQVEALEQTLGFTATAPSGAPIGGGVALMLADAIRRHRRVRSGYRSFSGERTQRELSPLGLVVHAARWYLAAYDHGREDLRTFRVDRMTGTRVTEQAALAPAEGFDAVAHVSLSLARVPWTWEVEVLLDLPVDQAAERLPPTLAELAQADGQTLLRMRVSSLDWMATVLARLGCDFTIRAPHELRTSVQTLAARLAGCA